MGFPDITSKSCSKCKQIKFHTEFPRNKSHGWSKICFACHEIEKERLRIKRAAENAKRVVDWETMKKENPYKYRAVKKRIKRKWGKFKKDLNKKLTKFESENPEKYQEYLLRTKGKTNSAKKSYNRRRALYSSYEVRLKTYNDIKQSPDGYLMVECKYCGSWIIPDNKQVQLRLQACEGNKAGEGHFYCNDNCKESCPTFRQILYPKGFKRATAREVDTLIRQMCFKRDKWACIKCGKTNLDAQLHCHHIAGAVQSPMEANDIDNVITVCKECHKQIHAQKDCSYVDYQREKCA